jgi:hypothetical protein
LPERDPLQTALRSQPRAVAPDVFILRQYALTLVPYAINEGFLDFSSLDTHVWRNTSPADYGQNIRFTSLPAKNLNRAR